MNKKVSKPRGKNIGDIRLCAVLGDRDFYVNNVNLETISNAKKAIKWLNGYIDWMEKEKRRTKKN